MSLLRPHCLHIADCTARAILDDWNGKWELGERNKNKNAGDNDENDKNNETSGDADADKDSKKDGAAKDGTNKDINEGGCPLGIGENSDASKETSPNSRKRTLGVAVLSPTNVSCVSPDGRSSDKSSGIPKRFLETPAAQNSESNPNPIPEGGLTIGLLGTEATMRQDYLKKQLLKHKHIGKILIPEKDEDLRQIFE